MLLRNSEHRPTYPLPVRLWTADAASLLPQVDVPALVVIGKKDFQVDWQADGEKLEQAAAGREQVRFLFPENANHVLKQELRPRSELGPAEVATGYNSPKTYLDPQALAGIL